MDNLNGRFFRGCLDNYVIVEAVDKSRGFFNSIPNWDFPDATFKSGIIIIPEEDVIVLDGIIEQNDTGLHCSLRPSWTVSGKMASYSAIQAHLRKHGKGLSPEYQSARYLRRLISRNF